MTPPDNLKRLKPRAIRLPFDNRKEDIGTWAYRHRVGLCVTVVVYLLVAIVFMSAKIIIHTKPHQQGMYIDLNELAELEALRDQLQAQVEAKQEFDWSTVQNLTSNENSSNNRVQDDRGTNISELNDSAQEIQRQMDANRQEWEQGVAQAQALRTRQGDSGEDNKHEDRRIEGNVTASYSLNNPLRHARNLVIPAYRCKGGGEVIVSITVNNIGEVISAKVVRGGDDCMKESALNAAKASRFDSNKSAPARHIGEISYIFIPQ